MPVKTSSTEAHYTTTEFEQLAEFNQRFELIDGSILEKPKPTFDHSFVAHQLQVAIFKFDPSESYGLLLQEVRLKTRLTTSSGNYLVPDLSYWVASHQPAPGVTNAAAPDLVIEIQSPEQALKDLVNKIPEYFAVGVQLVWIIQPARQIVMVYRPGETAPETIGIAGELDGENVIAGFKLKVAELFKK